jgi:MFS family permease
MGGYYQSFGPSIARDELGSSSAFVAAMVVASYLAPTALGGPIAARLSYRGAQRLGIGIITAGIVGLAASIAAHAVIPFILIGIVAGIAQGIAASGAMGGLLPKATGAERAGLLATIYAVSYLGAALPSFLAGALAPVLPLGVITLGYAALALLAFAMTFVPSGGSGGASVR